MIGMLIWDRAGHGLRPVRMKEISVLHVRFLCGEVTARERTAAVARSHRLRTAGRRLLRQGVERVVLPEGSAADVLPKGLRPVSTLALRRAIAADWAGELLRLRQQPPGGARVLVTANALSGEVVRTVTELALRHRYLLLTVPFGGEELCRRLRREYGVSVLLNPTAEQRPLYRSPLTRSRRRAAAFCRCMTSSCRCRRYCCRPPLRRVSRRE